MRPLYHVIASLVLAFLVYILMRQIEVALFAFLVGVFVDLDHLIDFWVLEPSQPLSIKAFLDSERYGEQRKWIFLFFHGWEWVALLFVLAYYYNWNIYLLVAGVALALHFFMDIKNLSRGPEKGHPFTYFFFFRLIKGFKKKNLIII